MKPRIMVVDDDAESCRALSELLASEGFETMSFESGEEAWAAIASQQLPPDIVIADVRMPGLDGVALVQRIKARFAAVPVVLVSAFPDEPIWVQGLDAGALDVFPKPIHGASLVRALRKALGAAQKPGQLVGHNPDPRDAGISERRSGS
ncbi:MAG: response regulator [Candidatus Methylomirabilota bacterium]